MFPLKWLSFKSNCRSEGRENIHERHLSYDFSYGLYRFTASYYLTNADTIRHTHDTVSSGCASTESAIPSTFPTFSPPLSSLLDAQSSPLSSCILVERTSIPIPVPSPQLPSTSHPPSPKPPIRFVYSLRSTPVATTNTSAPTLTEPHPSPLPPNQQPSEQSPNPDANSSNIRPRSSPVARGSFKNRPAGAISWEKRPCSPNRTVLLSIPLGIRRNLSFNLIPPKEDSNFKLKFFHPFSLPISP
ncbi:hypothetical protein KY285_000278 [Solanum tuberosum]|nr:hypothetical protein KY284_000315 [Solanum tuberosum]KAH0764407.1 hypothetical protein KY285_000278 [Solanum tuberosum]